LFSLYLYILEDDAYIYPHITGRASYQPQVSTEQCQPSSPPRTLSPPAISGPEILLTIARADFHMLGTTEGGIQDWRPTYGLSGFNWMVLQAGRELTDFFALLASNTLNDSTYNLNFPFNIHPRVSLRNEIIISYVCPLHLNAGGDIENQAGCSGPDQAIFFE